MHIKNKKWFWNISDSPLLSIDYRNGINNLVKRDMIIKKAKDLIRSPYNWGNNGPDSFDSAGFVQFVYKSSIGKNIPRTVFEQLQCGEKITTIEQLLPGDLVFLSKGVHVGIYIGNNELIHAPFAGKRVKTSPISDFYSGRRYL